MRRPLKCGKVLFEPRAYYFKPRAVPLYEFQALKYAGLEGKEQTAAPRGISRQTFGNILASARRKLADTVLNGKALRIGGRQENTQCPPSGGKGNGIRRRK